MSLRTWVFAAYMLYPVPWEFGEFLRPWYHALRQPVGAADRTMLHN